MKKYLLSLLFCCFYCLSTKAVINHNTRTLSPVSLNTQYPNYYQSIEARNIVNSGDWTSDGALGTISIDNNYLYVNFDSAWSSNQTITTGTIASLNIYPAIEHIELGPIYSGSQETGYYAKIENNDLIIYAVNPGSFPYFNMLYFGINIDLNCAVTWYKDNDADGYGDPNSIPITDCYQPQYNYVANNSDCNDQNSTIINGQNWYYDSDNDGFGDSTDYNPIISCTKPYGNYVSNNLDTCSTSYSTTGNGCPQNTPLVNENYIHTITPTTPTTNVSSLTNNQKIESIAYFDGLGRPMQNIAIRAGGNNQDIITPIEYDSFGRQEKDYLPYSATSNGGLYRSSGLTDVIPFYQNEEKYEYTANPYSQKEFEASPLNRVLRQAAPGNDWSLTNSGNHTIKFDYQTNSTDEVKLFTATTTWDATQQLYNISLTPSSYYAAGQLYKNITKDENWTGGKNNTTEEFKDKEGRVVLKRTYSDYKDINGTLITSKTPHDTYYVYDIYGNLTYVIPPKVNTDDGISQTELDELCYQYKYDTRNRLVEKKLPGKGDLNNWEEIVYNKLDQPILTRDPNLKAQGKWLFTKYDAFGRVAYTGLINNAGSRITMQSNANLVSAQYVSRSTATSIAGTSMNYNNAAYPSVAIGDEIYTINYYDDYGFDLNQASTTGAYDTTITNAKGLATGSKVRVLGTSNWITNVNYYDAKGRSICSYSKNDYLGTTSKLNSKLDFVGKVKETTATHDKTGKATITIVEKFTYDHQGRMLTQTQKINNQAEELIVSNKYDELGQLKEKGVGGLATATNRLQTVDYTYNIRGWLKGINDVNAMGADLFSFKINYNDITDVSKRLYNGNISQTVWKTANTDSNLKNYIYSYDALNRLTLAESQDSGRYNESMSYDKNGNIVSLLRLGNTVLNTQNFGTIDNLGYVYDAGNKLLKVEDSSNNSEGFNNGSSGSNTDYSYDANGNMQTDANKNITFISYNHLNLPTKITFNTGEIDFVYDATGVKQRKMVSTGVTTDYAAGYIYENNNLKFFSQPEGYVSYNSGTFDYIYQYKDHLGNVRLSYDKNLAIVEENNYYPFGLKQKGYNNIPNYTFGNPQAEKYKYNGKELQDENIGGVQLNLYDYGARNYDPALGRWMNIDPLAEISRRYSPYNYANNNPVFFIDPDGMAVHEFADRTTYDGDDAQNLFRTLQSQSRGSDAKESESNSSGPGDPPKKEPSIFKQLLLGIPVLGATIESSDKMGEGDYLGATLSFAAGVLDLFTLGTANKYKSGTTGVIAGVEGITAKNATKNAGSLVKILHVEDDIMMFSSKVGKETVEGISNYTVKEGKLYLNQLHLQGSSAGKVGRESLWEMARDLGRQYNVKEVIIQGGRRTTGKYKGQMPSPITIKVH